MSIQTKRQPFPETKPKITIKLEAELVADFDKYANGSMFMTNGSVSFQNKAGEKVGSVHSVMGAGGFEVAIGERRYFVSAQEVFDAVYDANKDTI